MCVATVLHIYQHTISSPAMISYTNNRLGSVIVVICVVVFPLSYPYHTYTHVLSNRRWSHDSVDLQYSTSVPFHVYTIRYLVYGRLS